MLTIFPVEHDLQFELYFLLQCQVDLPAVLLRRVGAVQEAARAALLHDLRPREPRELAEPVRTVDDRERGRHLRIAENEVAVWKQRGRGRQYQKTEGKASGCMRMGGLVVRQLSGLTRHWLGGGV